MSWSCVIAFVSCPSLAFQHCVSDNKCTTNFWRYWQTKRRCCCWWLELLPRKFSFQNARGCWTRTWHAHDDDDDLVSESNIYNHNFVASRETIFQNNLACACVLFSKQSSILTWTGDTELSGAMAATPFILLWHCDHHHHYCYCYISEAVVIKIFVILFCQFFFTIATLVGR